MPESVHLSSLGSQLVGARNLGAFGDDDDREQLAPIVTLLDDLHGRVDVDGLFWDEDDIRAAGDASIPLLPGIMTPTELIAARAAGFNACKLFPAQQAGGVEMLKALAGPFPDHVFCPTGGITRDNAAQFLALPNVLCVGGSWVAPAAAIAAHDWGRIEALARDAAKLRRGT